MTSVLERILPLSETGITRAEELAISLERLIADTNTHVGVRLGTKRELRARFEFAEGTINEVIEVSRARNRGRGTS